MIRISLLTGELVFTALWLGRGESTGKGKQSCF